MKKAQVLSTICISAALVAGPVLAQTAPDGCYSRHYAPEHLAAHPQQVVETLLLSITDQGRAFAIAARMADQGHAGRDGFGGLVMREEGMCNQADCAVYCDGGGFEISAVSAQGLDITTRGIRVIAGESCGGEALVSNLAEVWQQPTTYRLYRSPFAVCGAGR